MPLEKIYPNYNTDNISKSEAVKNFGLFSMIFEVPQFFLVRGDNQWVPRFLLLIGDTIRLSHDFLPHQKRSFWWKILHQTHVALQFSISCAPCHKWVSPSVRRSVALSLRCSVAPSLHRSVTPFHFWRYRRTS